MNKAKEDVQGNNTNQIYTTTFGYYSNFKPKKFNLVIVPQTQRYTLQQLLCISKISLDTVSCVKINIPNLEKCTFSKLYDAKV